MKKIWYTILLFWNVIKIARDPNETKAGLSAADCLYKMGLLEPELKKLHLEPADSNVIRSRKLLNPLVMDELLNLPEGSLGHTYASFMKKNNLDPNFYEAIEIKNDCTFIMMRMRQTHDLWHVITGFKANNVTGELGLLAFMFAQMHSPFSSIIIGIKLIVDTLRNPKDAREAFAAITRGWLMGQNAKSIFGLDWEAHWNTSLEVLRAKYNLQSAQVEWVPVVEINWAENSRQEKNQTAKLEPQPQDFVALGF